MNFKILKSCKWKIEQNIKSFEAGQIVNEFELNLEVINSMVQAGYLEAINEFKKIEAYENKMIDGIDNKELGKRDFIAKKHGRRK